MRRALAALALACAPLLAQTTESLRVPPDGDRGPAVCSVTLETFPGSERPGGYGYAWADVENHDRGRAHRVRVEVDTMGLRSAPYSCERSISLDPGERARVLLPLPSGDRYTARCTLSVQGVRGSDVARFSPAADGHGLAVLCVTDESAQFGAAVRAAFETELSGVVGSGRRGRKTSAVAAFSTATPDRLPDRWQWLTGFDVVVLDGAARLPAEAQRLLVEHVRGGGDLLVLRAASLVEGALRGLLAHDAGEPREGGAGLGRWRAYEEVPGSRTGLGLRAFLALRLKALDRRGLVGPLPAALHVPLQIPGLGAAPVRTFFVLILLFAVVVGPVNHFLAHRRRKPLLTLVTVPVLGFGCTVLLLGYGFVSEGLGIKGVERSVTLLDQRSHEAVAVAGRTLFAGLSPSALRTQSGSYLYSWDLAQDYRRERGAHALDLDLDRGAVSGSVLPSRTVTGVTTVTQAPCRERLRFRRRGDGEIEVLAGPQLQPVQATDAVLFMDFDRAVYSGNGAGSLVRHAGSVDERLRALAKALWLDGPDPDVRVPVEHQPLQLLVERLALVPGSYLAMVDSSPAVDDLGLEVETLRAVHVVYGVLAPEDVLEQQ